MQITEVKIKAVVACIIFKKEKVLITSRPYPKISFGFYEFPGGKVMNNEYYLEALCRELKEELNVELNSKKIFFIKNYFLKQKKLNLFFFACNSWKGTIKPMEGQIAKWVKVGEIEKYKFLRSNKNLVKFLIDSQILFPSCN